MAPRLLSLSVWSLLAASLLACGQTPAAPEPAPSRPDAAVSDVPDAGPPLAPADWLRSAVVYHVYVCSFADSDGDGSGDLRGLIDKLDYIADLGVDTLLLLPIVRGDHDQFGGYAPVDYQAVEDDYGTLDDVAALVAEADARGLRVMLDMPMDTVSDTHPWFAEAATSRAAPYRDHFVWTDAPCPPGDGFFGEPAWHLVAEIDTCYWAVYTRSVPEWDFTNPDVRAMMIAAGRFWIERGISGFRLDSAPWLVDHSSGDAPAPGTAATHAFWAEFMRAMKAEEPNFAAIAEVFDGDQAHLTAEQRVLVVVNLSDQPRAAGVDLAAASITTARVRDLIFGSAEPALSLDNASAYGPELAAHSGRWLALESPCPALSP